MCAAVGGGFVSFCNTHWDIAKNRLVGRVKETNHGGDAGLVWECKKSVWCNVNIETLRCGTVRGF